MIGIQLKLYVCSHKGLFLCLNNIYGVSARTLEPCLVQYEFLSEGKNLKLRNSRNYIIPYLRITSQRNQRVNDIGRVVY